MEQNDQQRLAGSLGELVMYIQYRSHVIVWVEHFPIYDANSEGTERLATFHAVVSSSDRVDVGL